MSSAIRVDEGPPRNERRRIMKVVSLQLTLQIAIVAIAFSATARPRDRHPAAVSNQSFGAKLEYCQDCHGPSGQGYRGFYPIPRLAGQQTEYLKNQLQAFVERRRTNNIMVNAARGLSPGMVAALANSFKNFNPRPLGGAPRGLVATGRKIFEEGVPEANIAACAACHGPDATGTGQIPRLAGQLYPYMIKVLVNWGSERRSDTSAIMEPIAHSLNRSQVEAVAAYVSDLK
jgi:cytochrome c553